LIPEQIFLKSFFVWVLGEKHIVVGDFPQNSVKTCQSFKKGNFHVVREFFKEENSLLIGIV